MSGQSLMTQYLEGALVSRELQDMLRTFAAEDRFDRALREMDKYDNELTAMSEQIARQIGDKRHV